MQQRPKHRGTGNWTLPEGMTKLDAVELIGAYDVFGTLKGAKKAYEEDRPGVDLNILTIKGIINHREVLGVPEVDVSAYYRKKYRGFTAKLLSNIEKITDLAAQRTIEGLMDPESAISKKQAPVILGIMTDKVMPIAEKFGLIGEEKQSSLSIEEARKLIEKAKGVDVVDVETQDEAETADFIGESGDSDE
jgi:hypothetical protein